MFDWLRRINWGAVRENLIADVIKWAFLFVLGLATLAIGAMFALLRGNPELALFLLGASVLLVLQLLIGILVYYRKNWRRPKPAVSPAAGATAAPTDAQEPQEVPPPLPEPPPAQAVPTLPPDIAQRVREYLEAERARAAFWEYQFLNRFLALHTQQALDWLINLGQRTTVQTYDAFWMPVVGSAQERIVVLDTLRNHHLINIDGHMIEVTPKGREYAAWRGPTTTPAPAPAPAPANADEGADE